MSRRIHGTDGRRIRGARKTNTRERGLDFLNVAVDVEGFLEERKRALIHCLNGPLDRSMLRTCGYPVIRSNPGLA